MKQTSKVKLCETIDTAKCTKGGTTSSWPLAHLAWTTLHNMERLLWVVRYLSSFIWSFWQLISTSPIEPKCLSIQRVETPHSKSKDSRLLGLLMIALVWVWTSWGAQNWDGHWPNGQRASVSTRNPCHCCTSKRWWGISVTKSAPGVWAKGVMKIPWSKGVAWIEMVYYIYIYYIP